MLRRTLGVLKVQQLELGVLLEGALEIPELAVDLRAQRSQLDSRRPGAAAVEAHLGDDRLLGQRLADAESNAEGGRLPARTLLDAAVGQGDGDGNPRLG